MRIITYNVNGIRAAIKKDFYGWLATVNPDILCLQEVKAMPHEVDLQPLYALGYTHVAWYPAVKKGYSGTATFSKIAPNQLITGIGIAQYDDEGRVLRTDYGDWTLLNCYFPSGTSGDVRQAVKIEFLNDLFDYIQILKQKRPRLIVVGDYNIAHQEMDLHNPASNQNTPGFTPEERAWMSKFLHSGWTDAFRHQHSDVQAYSWWSYRFESRAKNKGWRIDYQCVTNNLQPLIQNVELLSDAVHSDHCPVLMDIDLN
jgi:exodeoxyribonuclease-3